MIDPPLLGADDEEWITFWRSMYRSQNDPLCKEHMHEAADVLLERGIDVMDIPIWTYQLTTSAGEIIYATTMQIEPNKLSLLTTRNGQWAIDPVLTDADMTSPQYEINDWDVRRAVLTEEQMQELLDAVHAIRGDDVH